CFDRIVIYGYLSGLARPEQVVHFFRQVVGVPVVSKEVLSQRTADYQAWVEAFARNHRLPIEWAEKGVRKEDHVVPWQRRMARNANFGVSDRRFRFKPAGGFGGNRQAVSVQIGTPLRMGFGTDFGEPPLRDTSYLALVCQSKYSCHYYRF